jgi:Flp pilus assembly protein TadD
VIFPALILFTLVIGFARLRGEFYTVGVFRNEHKNDGRVIINSQMAQNLFYHVTPNTLPLSWFEGVAYYRLGDNQAAMRCFRDAICRTPYEVRVLNDYSAVLFRLGNAGLAIRTLRTTLVIDPFFDDARFNLAAIYFLTGQRKAAQLQVLYCRESQKKMDFLEEMK